MKFVTIMFFIILLSNGMTVHCQTWSPVGGGVNRHVRAFYVDTLNNELYLGGSFKYADGQVVNGVAKWDGVTYSPLGSGSDNCDNYTCPAFLSLTMYKGEVYCSNLGFDVGGVPSKSIVRWDGVEWDSVGGGLTFPDGGNGIVWEQMVHDDTLYIMGAFYLGGNVYSPGIVKWDGEQYLPTGFPFADFSISNDPWLQGGVFYNGELYVCGQFASGPFIDDQVDVAKFDGQTWQPVGGGITGLIGDAYDLAVYKGGLYISGNFRKSGGNAGNGIMKLSGGQWVDVGGSMDEEQMIVHHMIEYHGDLYVFGSFNSVGGGIEAINVAKWDGERWCGIGNTTDRRIECSAIFHDSIFIGGSFENIDGDSLPYLAKWYGDYTDTCGMVLSVSNWDIVRKPIIIFPNPCSDKIKVQLPDRDINQGEIRLLTALGQLVFTHPLHLGLNDFEVEGIAPGLYFYEVQDEGRVLHTGKLVKVE